MKTHFACAVIYRTILDNGRLGCEFLVVDYRSVNPKTGQPSELQTKFPGGMNRVPDEPVSVTVQREILEETYLACLPNSKEIWKKEVGEHTKYGFLIGINDCRGELRTEILNDKGDELLPPRWVSATTLGRDLFHGHQGVYLAACAELGVFFS